jgi:hypothetical protein
VLLAGEWPAGKEAAPVAGNPLLECSFLIPERRDRIISDGKPHPRRVWAWLEEELAAFGGATRAPGPYEGFYFDPQTKEKVWDSSRKYIVAVSRAQVAQVRELLRQACRSFQQKCIYLSVAGRVEFVEGDTDAPT